MAKFKILSYQKLEIIECIKIRILYILQKHKKGFKIQPPFNFVSFINDEFPMLSSKSCHTFLWVKSRNLVLILFTKNKTLDAFVSKQIFSVCYLQLIPSAALDICSEKILGDRKVWLWVSETDTTVVLVTEKCKGSYLAVYGLLSSNNSLLTETQFSVDLSLPSADVRFFNPFFFPTVFFPACFFFSFYM